MVTLATRPATGDQLPVAPPLTVSGEPPKPRRAPSHRRSRKARRKQRLGSTAVRLAAFHTLLLAAVLGIVVTVLLHQFTVSLQQIATSTLNSELDEVTTLLSSGPAEHSSYSIVREYLSTHALPSGQQLVIKVPGHTLLGTTGGLAVNTSPVVSQWLKDPPPGKETSQIQIGNLALDAEVQPLVVHDRVVGTAVAAVTLTTIEAQRHRLLMLSLAEGGVAVVVGTLSAYLVIRQLLRTIGRMTAAAEEIGQGGVEQRLGDPGTRDEVSTLARTLDAMLDRIAAVLESQRRLLSDVSHQLRTPMTVARGHLEVLARTGYADREVADETVTLVLDELGRMSEMVNSLLLLGRSMEPDFLQEDPVDVRLLVAEVYAAANVLADRSWTMGPVADVVISGDDNKLRGAMLNLVENAAKVTGRGDVVLLSCTIDPTSGAVVLGVDDAGPGIPDDLREAALARFGRLPGDRSAGSGLGLAIVDTVARAHGGRAEVTRSYLGGARVAIAIPAERRVMTGLPQ